MKRDFESKIPQISPIPTMTKILQTLTMEFVSHPTCSVNETLLQIEEAWWYYIDVYRLIYPELPQLDLPQFVDLISKSIITLQFIKTTIDKSSIDKIMSEFQSYKQKIDCSGAILLDKKLEYILLIKPFRTEKYGFPKGKMKYKEELKTCAIREVEEEIGFDISECISDEFCQIKQRKKKVTYFYCPNVPLETKFRPNTRLEIHEIVWVDILSFKKRIIEKDESYLGFRKEMVLGLFDFIQKRKEEKIDISDLLKFYENTSNASNLSGINNTVINGNQMHQQNDYQRYVQSQYKQPMSYCPSVYSMNQSFNQLHQFNPMQQINQLPQNGNPNQFIQQSYQIQPNQNNNYRQINYMNNNTISNPQTNVCINQSIRDKQYNHQCIDNVQHTNESNEIEFEYSFGTKYYSQLYRNAFQSLIVHE